LARWHRAGPHCTRLRPPPLKCRPTGLVGPGVTSSDIRVTSRGPWLAQGPRPRATKCPRHPGTPLERRGGARGRRGGGLGAGRGAHRAAPYARGRRNRSETAQVPLGETVQGDPGDPPGRSETPSGQPQQPLGGAGWLDWPAGTSRGRRAASRLSGVRNEVLLSGANPPEPRISICRPGIVLASVRVSSQRSRSGEVCFPRLSAGTAGWCGAMLPWQHPAPTARCTALVRSGVQYNNKTM